MLVNLVSKAEAIFDSVKEVRDQARKEGFEDFETDLLLKTYLEKGLGKARARYILYEKPRLEKQKKLTDNNAKIGKNDYNNVPEIPAPDNIVIPAEVVDEVINEQEHSEAIEALKPNYEVEELKLRLDTTQANLDQVLADKKNIEEKYKQLEAKTRLSPSNQIPAVQGNTLRVKVVVSDVFREVLRLKGSKIIYANVVIDIQQNKYVRLEPL
jgi:hypothetical protein